MKTCGVVLSTVFFASHFRLEQVTEGSMVQHLISDLLL